MTPESLLMIFFLFPSIYTKLVNERESSIWYLAKIPKRRAKWLYNKYKEKYMCTHERDQGATELPGLFSVSQHSEVPMHMLFYLLSKVFMLTQVGKKQTHSLSKGMEVLLLLFCTMLAWFLKEIRIIAGANLQGSPSTCMGMDL
jgi:hypothetical protein